MAHHPSRVQPGAADRPTACARVAALWCLVAAAAVATGQDWLPDTTGPVDHVAGRVLVVPVRANDDNPAVTLTLRLDDTRTVEARVYDVSRLDVAADRCEPSAWLAPPPTLVITPRARGARAAAGGVPTASVLVAEVPADAIGQSIWIERRRIDLRWLPDPELLAERLGVGTPEADDVQHPLASPLPRALREDEGLARLAAPARLDPARRWRATLMLRGLSRDAAAPAARALDAAALLIGDSAAPPAGPGEPAPDGAAAGPGVEADGPARFAVDTLASLQEDRWRVALLRLWEADEALSLAVRERLAGAAYFPTGVSGGGPGTAAPLWCADDASAAELLAAMVDPRASAASRASRARAWLAGQPVLLTWPIDDGPVAVGERRPVLGVLAPFAGGLVSATLPDGTRAAEPFAVERGLSVAAGLRVPLGPAVVPAGGAASGRTGADGAGVLPVTLAFGEATVRAEARGAALAVVPPGADLGPLRSAWTMSDFVADPQRTAARAGLPPPASWTRARLFAAPGSRGEPLQFSLYVECAAGGAAAAAAAVVPGGEADSVRVILDDGAGGGPRVVTVSRDGPVPERVVRSAEAERWAFVMALPSGADAGVGAGSGQVRLALDRTDACGRRTSWPHRVLPWQGTPGGAALSTAAWPDPSRPR